MKVLDKVKKVFAKKNADNSVDLTAEKEKLIELYKELEKAGFIKTVQGKGSYVAPKNLSLIKEEKLKEIQDYIEKIFEISKVSNISDDEVLTLFKMIFKEEI